MRLLVVEDNERLAAVMLRLLGEHGFVADRVATVDAALAALDLAPYDLILLDLSLPDGDGSAVLRAIRQRCRADAGAGRPESPRQGTPVLVATARGEVVERVRMLDLGADDYLVKPFSLDELLARVRALLRRPRHIADPVLAAGNVRLDTASLTLTVDGERVDAPRRELGVLAALLASQGRLLRKQALADAIYSFDNEVTPNAVEAAVSRLRRRLEAHGATITVNAMRGLGYILAVQEAHADARAH